LANFQDCLPVISLIYFGIFVALHFPNNTLFYLAKMTFFAKRPVDDIEALPEKRSTSENDSTAEYKTDDGAVATETFVLGDGFYAKAQRFAGKLGVEQRGIERVPENERTDSTMSSIGTLVCIPLLER
jgi:hypothetical protein